MSVLYACAVRARVHGWMQPRPGLGALRACPVRLVAQAQPNAGDGPALALLSVLLRHGYDPNQQVSACALLHASTHARMRR